MLQGNGTEEEEEEGGDFHNGKQDSRDEGKARKKPSSPDPLPALAEGDRQGRGAGPEVGVLQPEDTALLCRAGHPLCRLLYEVTNLHV